MSWTRTAEPVQDRVDLPDYLGENVYRDCDWIYVDDVPSMGRLRVGVQFRIVEDDGEVSGPYWVTHVRPLPHVSPHTAIVHVWGADWLPYGRLYAAQPVIAATP